MAKAKANKKAVKKPAVNPKVILYSMPSCPYCKLAKAFLDRHKIKYSAKDVSKDHGVASEMIGKTGQAGVPVIIVGKTVVVGYDEAALKKALKIRK